MGKVFVLKSSHGGRQGGRWGPKIPFLAPKRAILGNRGQKTARRAAQRAPTGKPKVSRVASETLDSMGSYPSYPEVTMDTFGFLVGARSAARRAIFWPRLPKMALFVANNACRLQRSCWSTLVIQNGWNGVEQVTGHPG